MDATMRTPDRKFCLDLLARYRVPVHVVEHSLRVAQVGTFVASHLLMTGHDIDQGLVEAGAMLHDITKIEAMKRGEDHAATGGLLVSNLGYPALAEIVRQHIRLDQQTESALRLTSAHIVNYADKRVRHTSIVPLPERFKDLMVRYGTSNDRKRAIEDLYEKTRALEENIFSQLDLDPEVLCELNNININTHFAP